MEFQADANHFMLEPIGAKEMEAVIEQEERNRRVHEAMGMGLLFPMPQRNTRRQYGRPNAKVIGHWSLKYCSFRTCY